MLRQIIGLRSKQINRKIFKKFFATTLALATVAYIGFGPYSRVPVSVGAKNVTVCKPSGCDFTEIQAAINDVFANGGGTVSVKAGTYSERITLKSGVSVVGESAASTTINGPSVGPNNEKVTGADNATFSGFTLDGQATVTYGVYNSGVSPTLKDLVIKSFTENGIRNLSGAAPKIQNNTINGNGGAGHAGIYTSGGGAAIEITGNEVYGNASVTGDGIYHNGTNGLIADNLVYTNPSNGISLIDSSAAVIRNTVRGPSQDIGISIQGGSPEIVENIVGDSVNTLGTHGISINTSAPSNLKIINNTVQFNFGNNIIDLIGGQGQVIGNLIQYSGNDGLFLTSGSYEVRDNMFRNSSGSAISLNTSPTVEIVSNVITENGTSIASGAIIDNSCNAGVNIHHNLLYANKDDGYEVGAAATCASPTITNNVFDKNVGNAINTDDQALVTIEANTITNNTGYGILKTGAAASTQKYNNVYSNTAGNYSGWTQSTTDFSVNPLYMQDYFPTQIPFYALQSVSDGYGSGMSPLIDRAEPIPAYEDTFRPPARGGVRGDVGAYGGDVQKPAAKVAEVKVDGTAVADGGSITLSNKTPKITGITGQDLIDAGNTVRIYRSGANVGEDTVLLYQCDSAGCSDTSDKKSAFDITTIDLGANDEFTLNVVMVNALNVESDAYQITVKLDSSYIAPGAPGSTPAQITDLRITGFSVIDSTVELSWTAPDNGSGAAATEYDIRFSHAYLHESTWDQGSRYSFTITPAAPGTTQSIRIPVNQAGTLRHKADQDQDGLTDYMETFLWGTNPVAQDSDGDGYFDVEETTNGFSPLFAFPYKPDADGDGFFDEWEDRHGLDKNNPDTDGDGYDDFTEYYSNYDPRNPEPKSNFFDRDKDGLSDFKERYVYGTNPANPDTDLDGYTDLEEVRNGFDPVKVYYFGIKSKNSAGGESVISNRVSRYVY